MNRITYVTCAVFFAACTMGENVEDLDPASTLGDEQMEDEGPLPEDEASDVDANPEAIPEDEIDPLAAGIPNFQLPFPCGQVWAGQTRTNHSPVPSVDFNRSNDEGDTVVAAASGRVTRVSNTGNTSYGRWIEIAHGGNTRTRYAHLSTQVVSVGQSVARGQKIGTVGNTGGSTGAHLHYEQHVNGVAVRAKFNGITALYYGTKNYTSQNGCGAGTGGGSGGAVVGRVNTAGASLTIRSTASTSGAAVGSVADGATVTITCQKRGQSVTGTYGTSTLWDKVNGGYIADAYVSTGSDGQVAPTCP